MAHTTAGGNAGAGRMDVAPVHKDPAQPTPTDGGGSAGLHGSYGLTPHLLIRSSRSPPPLPSVPWRVRALHLGKG